MVNLNVYWIIAQTAPHINLLWGGGDIYLLVEGHFRDVLALCAILQQFLSRQNMDLSNYVLVYVKFCKQYLIIWANFVRERVFFS